MRSTSHSIESLAQEMVGNWQKFNSFCWHRQYNLESPEEWTMNCPTDGRGIRFRGCGTTTSELLPIETMRVDTRLEKTSRRPLRPWGILS